MIQGSFPGGRPRILGVAAPAPPRPVPVAVRPAVQPAGRPGPVHPPARPGTPGGRNQPILPGAATARCRPARQAATPSPCRRASSCGLPSLGQRLPEAVQQKMESFFNTSFADVRVHVGGEAASIGALAFTIGADLYFAPGQYNPQDAPRASSCSVMS